eukprot:3537075-Amphidinium_carterae.1
MGEEVLDNSRRVHANFDRDQIVQLLQSVILPLPMAEQLPDILHGGKLLSNRFLSILSTKIVKLPPRPALSRPMRNATSEAY